MAAIEVQIRKLMNFFIVLFVVITGVLVYWQVGQAQALTNSPYKVCIASEQPIRGNIYDRNGVLLAYSVRDNNSPCGWRRMYTIPSLSPLLGYFSYTYGATGIERYYNSVLDGENTPNDFNTESSQFINSLVHQPVNGSNIYLSIDSRIQKYVDSVFTSQDYGGACGPVSQAGSIIVEDPQTGEILAMVSRPYYDDNKISDPTPAPNNPNLTVGQEYWQQINSDPTLPLYNRALQGQYAPGSTFKTVTLIAALDSGQFTLGTSYTQSQVNSFVVNGFTVHNDGDPSQEYGGGPVPPTYPMDLTHAYAYSLNVVYARVGVQLGPQIEQEYASRFYLSTPDNEQLMPIDTTPVANSHLYINDPLTDPAALAATSYGQGQLFLNPMTMELIASSVANGGQLADPHFLIKIVPHGTNPASVAATTTTGVHQIFSSQTAQEVQQAMRADVAYGTIGASGGNIASVGNLPENIEAKTGTAQGAGQYPGSWVISIGHNPFSNGPPTLAITIMKEQTGSGACQAPILGDIYQEAFQTLSG